MIFLIDKQKIYIPRYLKICNKLTSSYVNITKIYQE